MSEYIVPYTRTMLKEKRKIEFKMYKKYKNETACVETHYEILMSNVYIDAKVNLKYMAVSLRIDHVNFSYSTWSYQFATNEPVIMNHDMMDNAMSLRDWAIRTLIQSAKISMSAQIFNANARRKQPVRDIVRIKIPQAEQFDVVTEINENTMTRGLEFVVPDYFKEW